MNGKTGSKAMIQATYSSQKRLYEQILIEGCGMWKAHKKHSPTYQIAKNTFLYLHHLVIIVNSMSGHSFVRLIKRVAASDKTIAGVFTSWMQEIATNDAPPKAKDCVVKKRFAVGQAYVVQWLKFDAIGVS